jgi:hypothetical protein
MFNFLFGKKSSTKRRSKKKSTKSKKPPKSLISKCKKMGVRVTKKVGNKRLYKSVLTLEKQCKIKKRAVKKSKLIPPVVSRSTSPKTTINRKNVLKKKMRAAAIALGGLKSSRDALSQRFPGDLGLDMHSRKINKENSKLSSERKNIIEKNILSMMKGLKNLSTSPSKVYSGSKSTFITKKMTPDRRNVIKKKIIAAARISRMLKESRVALNKRYPGDPGVSSSKMSPERKKMIKNKILAAAKLLKKKDNNQLQIFNAYPTVPPPTKGSIVSYEKKNNFGSYYSYY